MVNYRKIWQDHSGLKIPKGWHIHHIDGDQTNNSPDNLICVSPEEHWLIHYSNGDPIAINGKFIQGAGEAGKRGGAVVLSGQIAKIQTKENQDKGRRNRDPKSMSEMGYIQGRKNVANGTLAKARALSPTLGNKEWGHKYAGINGKKNRGKVHVTNISTGEDRKLTKAQALHLASGEWRLGRTRGGWNTFSPDLRQTIQLAGIKASLQSPNHPNNQQLTCPHCRTVADLRNARRWHFDNCRYLKV